MFHNLTSSAELMPTSILHYASLGKKSPRRPRQKRRNWLAVACWIVLFLNLGHTGIDAFRFARGGGDAELGDAMFAIAAVAGIGVLFGIAALCVPRSRMASPLWGILANALVPVMVLAWIIIHFIMG
jgi:hypothetical protein